MIYFGVSVFHRCFLLFRRKTNCMKKNVFSVVVLSQEAHFGLCERYDFAFTRGMRAWSCLSETEKKCVSCFFVRGAVLIPWEARFCLARECLSKMKKCIFCSFLRETRFCFPREARFSFRERHGHASHKWKKTHFFARCTVLLSRRASRKQKKSVFCFFSFHERHNCAFAGWKKIVFSIFSITRGTIFCPGFVGKKVQEKLLVKREL